MIQQMMTAYQKPHPIAIIELPLLRDDLKMLSQRLSGRAGLKQLRHARNHALTRWAAHGVAAAAAGPRTSLDP
jgi:hypothetical protein